MAETSPETTTMRAFRWDNATSTFNRREIPVPEPKQGEAPANSASTNVVYDVGDPDG